MFRTALIPLFFLSFSAHAADDAVSFKRDVAPILAQHCVACHNAKKAKGKYRVDTFDLLIAADRPADKRDIVVPGQPDKSVLLELLIEPDAEFRMPQDADALPAKQVSLIKRWIEQGATFDGSDRKADLSTLLRDRQHPKPPSAYPRALPISAVSFSADGKSLYAGGYHEVTVWDIASGKLKKRFQSIAQRTYALRLSADGKSLAVVGGDPGVWGEVRLIDVASDNLVRVLHTSGNVALDAAFDPSGKRLAVAGADAQVVVYDVATGKRLHVLTGHTDWVTSLAWDKDGKRIATSSRDKTAKVFDVATGNVLATYTGHGRRVVGVAFKPDGNAVWSADGRSLHVWNIHDEKKQAEIGGIDGGVKRIDAVGDTLLVAGGDGKVRRYNINDRKLGRTFEGHSEWAQSVAVSTRGDLLAAGGFDGRVVVWRVEGGEMVGSWVAAPGLRGTPTD